MQTQITQNGDIVIVRLKGAADFESVLSLDETCQKYLNQKKVIFNLSKLNFVGSSGIDNLTQMIEKLNRSSSLKVCHVSSEFRRIFASSPLKHLEIYDDENGAKLSFH